MLFDPLSTPQRPFLFACLFVKAPHAARPLSGVFGVEIQPLPIINGIINNKNKMRLHIHTNLWATFDCSCGPPRLLYTLLFVT